AKGKRLTTYEVETINELEPQRSSHAEPLPEEKAATAEESDSEEDTKESNIDIIDEITGQMKLFDE
ncbi:hypothetical protein LJC35_05020, partial [Parabacteroides sp. OttesenSCG-928-N08]|nr:hypothetical protein [Parabacteroides sp. OttesenSCG-928-N08]